MAEEKKKEMTKEEKEAEFKKQQDFQMQVLLADYGIIGSNYAKLNYGKKGGSFADNYMNTNENALKIKQQLYAEEKREYENAGVAWDAVMPDNGSVAYYAKQMTDPALQTLTSVTKLPSATGTDCQKIRYISTSKAAPVRV